MVTRNTGQTREGLERLRQGDGGTEPLSYRDEGNIPQTVRGDQDAPFVKEPPFTTRVKDFFYDANLNLASAGYQFTTDINVLDWRMLTLVINYVAIADDQLSIIPEFSMDDYGATFYPIGVISALVTAVTLPTVVVPFEPPYGSRTFYPTELRTPVLANGDDLHQSLTFDVANYNRYRFGVGSLLAEGTPGPLTLSYILSL